MTIGNIQASMGIAQRAAPPSDYYKNSVSTSCGQAQTVSPPGVDFWS